MNERSIDQHGVLLAEPFSWKASQAGLVFLEYLGRPVKILRGTQARKFLGRIEQLEDQGAQLLIARLTGNFKRGNERD
jgi:hypothetical protein